jgi:hypothetical protein
MPAASSSILAVDFGNVNRRAVLIDLVDGTYTVVAQATERTTAGFPNHDVSIGLGRIARQIGVETGRIMLSPDNHLIMPEQPDRSGVDSFIATASIGRPLRTVLVGLVPEISVASALRAASGTYIDILDRITLEDTRPLQERLNAIILARPDLIFMAGGTEDGAREPVLALARLVRTAVSLMRGHAPLVLYAGNSDLREDIRQLIGGAADVVFTDNVRPAREVERLDAAQLELGSAYNRFAGQRGMGFDTVARMTRLGVQPNAQSYHLVTDYLGRISGPRKNVLVVDIGASASTISAWVRGRVTTSIRTDIGLGASARSTLDIVGLEAVDRWLPFVTYEDEILSYAMNKTLRPALVPDTLRALYLEHGLLRAAIEGLVQAARPTWTPDTALDDLSAPLEPFDRIIGAGAGLCSTGRPGMSAMLLLDAIQPRGIVRLQLDSAALIPALGALARLNPEASVQLMDGTGFEDLGTAVSLTGTPRAGRAAAEVTVVTRGITEKHRVEAGQLWLHSIPPATEAEVTIRTARGMTINGARRAKFTMQGGTAGLIVDARGRPLVRGADARAFANQLAGWYAAATGDPIREVSIGWLEDMMAENIAGVTRDGAPAPKKRRFGRRDAKPAKPDKPRRGKAVQTAPGIRDSAELPEVPVYETPSPQPGGRRGVKKLRTKEPVPTELAPQTELSDDDLRNLLS